MNVSLTPQLEKLIREKVESGLYGSASEVVREALRVLEEREAAREELRRELRVGLEDVEKGREAPLDIEEIKKEARRRRRGQG
jgi:antitoxin ParD1/3/4